MARPVQGATSEAEQKLLLDLLQELLDAYIDACAQGTGVEPLSSPSWHMYISTYEEADELIPRARDYLDKARQAAQQRSSQ